jgi:hypothetical protein
MEESNMEILGMMFYKVSSIMHQQQKNGILVFYETETSEQ